MSSHRFHLVPQADGAQEGVGPVHHGRRAAFDEGATARIAPITQNPLTPQQSRDMVLNVMTPLAARGVREDARVPVRDQRDRRRPLPRVVLLPAQLRRHGAAPDRDARSRRSRS